MSEERATSRVDILLTPEQRKVLDEIAMERKTTITRLFIEALGLPEGRQRREYNKKQKQ